METQSKVLKWSVIIGIVIVLNLLFNYTISLLYKEPTYEAFCPTSQVVNVPDNQQACVSQGGQWTNNASYNAPNVPLPPPTKSPMGYCNLQYTCGNNYDTASKNYSLNVFAILVLLGALSVFAGNFLKGNAVLSNGLALGGVFSFIIASMRYWGSANSGVRVIILLIAFGLLVWVAMKKFNNKNQNESVRP
jgi:hypothetical protein